VWSLQGREDVADEPVSLTWFPQCVAFGNFRPRFMSVQWVPHAFRANCFLPHGSTYAIVLGRRQICSLCRNFVPFYRHNASFIRWAVRMHLFSFGVWNFGLLWAPTDIVAVKLLFTCILIPCAVLERDLWFCESRSESSGTFSIVLIAVWGLKLRWCKGNKNQVSWHI
jgi:hypothetical protein